CTLGAGVRLRDPRDQPPRNSNGCRERQGSIRSCSLPNLQLLTWGATRAARTDPELHVLAVDGHVSVVEVHDPCAVIRAVIAMRAGPVTLALDAGELRRIAQRGIALRAVDFRRPLSIG